MSGEGLVDLTIVAEELGRMVQPGPFQATNIVAFALTESGTPEQKERYLPVLTSGEVIGTWAFAEGDETWAASSTKLAATPQAGGYLLEGTKRYVHDAQAADVLLVTARGPEGLVQFVVDKNTAGVAIEPLECLDLARRMADVRFDGVRVPAEAAVGPPGEAAGAAVERQLQVALVLQCADTIGAAGEGLARTVQYSKDRVAFGRPIGSYQALKHRMADHRIWLEGSFATTAYAARAVQHRRPDAAIAVRVAKAHVGKWSSAMLHDCIQLHGGIGMTWDYDLHLYFRRAISNEVLYGAPDAQCRSLVDLVEGAA